MNVYLCLYLYMHIHILYRIDVFLYILSST
jgi:hypothetical protein